jgi:cytochrome c-type biogenesis protein CcmH/NrfG
MGWLALAIIGLAAGAALWLAGVPRAVASFAAAALFLGATGYALQGKPGLAAHPVAAESEAMELEPGMLAFRQMVLRPADRAAFEAADAAIRRGDPGDAVRAMLGAVERRPRDAAAWTWLGVAYAAHDGGQLSAGAKFAFARAMKLAPAEPGPPFFLGLSAFDARDLALAKQAWEIALAATPANAPYRQDIAMRVKLVNAIEAMQAGQAPPSRE